MLSNNDLGRISRKGRKVVRKARRDRLTPKIKSLRSLHFFTLRALRETMR